jgi:tetratricopeptide (TPR) repeat protein
MKLRISAFLLITACFTSPSFASEGAAPTPGTSPEPVDSNEQAQGKPPAPPSEEADTPAETEERQDGDQQLAPSEEIEPPLRPLDDPTQAREDAARDAFRRGDRLYLEGDYEGAVVSFEEAYALSGRIEMLFNLANAHERLGNYSEASVALRGYIPHSPEGDRPALERRLARFETLAEKEKEQADETARTAKKLQENPRPFPVARTFGIGLITLGSAAVVNGVAFAISAAGARKKLNSLCEGEGGTRLCPAEAQMPLDRDKTHSLIADISLISGALLGATGVYLVIRSGESNGQKIEAGVGPGSIRVGGTF